MKKNILFPLIGGALIIIAGVILSICLTNKSSSSETSSSSLVTSSETKTYQVTYHVNNGEDDQIKIYNYGDDISLLDDLSRPYYQFEAWYLNQDYTILLDQNMIVTKDLDLYAKWNPLTYSKITLENTNLADNTIIGEIGTTLNLPLLDNRTYYHFQGWYLDSDYQNEFLEETFPTDNLTLYAKWELDDAYAFINYYINDTLIEEKIINKGDVITAPDYLEEHHLNLEHYYVDQDYLNQITEDYLINDSINVYLDVGSKGLIYDKNKITAYQGVQKDVIIPRKHDSYEIDTLGAYAFYASDLTSITINNIQIIEDYAFYQCNALTNVNANKDLLEIGKYAFNDCQNLISLPNINTSIIKEGTFINCLSLTDIALNNVTKIESYAFAHCENLTSFHDLTKVTSLGDYAFAYCQSITSLNFVAIEEIQEDVFYLCSNLQEITIDENNAYFTIKSHHLFSKNLDTLYLYLQYNKQEIKYNLPSSVTTIKKGAFNNNDNLQILDLSNVENIEFGALEKMHSLQELTLDNIGVVDSSKDKDYLGYYFGEASRYDSKKNNTYVCSSLKKVTFTGNVTYVSDYAFYGINSLEEIEGLELAISYGEYAFAYTSISSFTIESEVETIANTTFYQCDKLLSLNINKINKNFAIYDNCLYTYQLTTLYLVLNSKETISFIESCTTISSFAFYGSKITTLEIPSSIVTLEKNSLYGMRNLITLSMPLIANDNNYLGYYFGATLNVNNNGESILINNINRVPNTLRNILITSEESEVPNYLFANFYFVKNISFANSITSVGDFSFYNCQSLSTIDVDHLETIGKYAYAYCMDLEEINFPSCLQALGDYAFKGDYSLSKVSFQEGITSLPKGIFTAYSESNKYYSSLQEINIPNSVTSIDEEAFLGCGIYGTNHYTLKVDISVNDSTLTSIGKDAFAYSSIKKISLPNTLEVIDEEAFYQCDYLETVNIGNNGKSCLKTLGKLSFGYCYLLKSIIINKTIENENDLPSLINEEDVHPFYNSDQVSIYVPNESLTYYLNNDEWNTIGNLIKTL